MGHVLINAHIYRHDIPLYFGKIYKISQYIFLRAIRVHNGVLVISKEGKGVCDKLSHPICTPIIKPIDFPFNVLLVAYKSQHY
jgi:hypothetical protein